MFRKVYTAYENFLWHSLGDDGKDFMSLYENFLSYLVISWVFSFF